MLLLICLLIEVLIIKKVRDLVRKRDNELDKMSVLLASSVPIMLVLFIGAWVFVNSDKFCTYELVESNKYVVATSQERPNGYEVDMDDTILGTFTFYYHDEDEIKQIKVTADNAIQKNEVLIKHINIEKYKLNLFATIFFIKNPIQYKVYFNR